MPVRIEPLEIFCVVDPAAPRDFDAERASARAGPTAGESLADVLKRADSAWSPERAAAANGFTSEQVELQNGRPLKVARWERYAGKPEESAQ